MDINMDEWKVLAQLVRDNVLANVDQLVVEV